MKQKKERPTGNCASCGKSFVIPSGTTKKKFCDVKCSGKMHEKRHGADTKIPCLKCHASLLMTGAQSGRLLNWPKQRVSEIRKRFGLKTLSNKEARAKSLGFKPKKMDWWGDESAATGWMSEYRVKDFNWGYVWEKEKSRISSLIKYHALSTKEKRAIHKRRMLCPIRRRNKQKAMAKWKAKARANDPVYKIIDSFRSRLSVLARNKGTTTIELIGCNQDHLRSHLESKFKSWMTWDNYGKRWHVDHIIPVSSFDHSDPNQLKRCWHWTNLEPLGARANMSKGCKITRPQMSLMI